MPTRIPSFRLVKSSQLPRARRRIVGCAILPFGLALASPATIAGWNVAWQLGVSLLARLSGLPNTAVGNFGGPLSGVPAEERIIWSLFWGLGALILFVAVRDIICWRHDEAAPLEASADRQTSHRTPQGDRDAQQP